MTIELFVTDEPIDTDRSRQLATRVLNELTTGDSAPDSTLARARELTHVVVHQPQAWATGGPDVRVEPRYIVRVTVPGTWCSEGFADHVIPAITRAIGEIDGDSQRLQDDPHCLVQVVGLREGSFGTCGRVYSSADVTRMISEDFRHSAAAAASGAVDPVCGMSIDPATARFRLRHAGVDYVFCASVCRKVFAEDHGIVA
ncbi:ATPase [Nocardia huaxiensis]|uniref:ATPase n=1 Tax=Nocardia huaxiensis TaxID=2755382 RepID=UPI001E5670F7|nr:ATPase [Nocardia huaxiensis]UFS97083.1 ATPase [Nocardia huaxiensis]